MNSGDRFYFSPDIGHLVWRGEFFYTEHGFIERDTIVIRMIPIDGFVPNYADWSNEERTTVRLAFEAEQKKYKAREKRQRKRRARLVEQARAKLTEAEFAAVCGWSDP